MLVTVGAVLVLGLATGLGWHVGSVLVPLGALLLTAAACLLRYSLRTLSYKQQLRVQGVEKVGVVNGPGLKFVNPFLTVSCEIRDAISLGELDYIKVKNSSSGAVRVERGPQLLFLGAYDEASGGPCAATSITSRQYLKINDKNTGEITIIKGPTVHVPGPYETVEVAAALALTATQYVFVRDTLSGNERVVKGPQVFVPGPYDEPRKITTAISLRKDEYVKIKDSLTGKIWMERGEKLLFLEPTWEAEGVCRAWPLKAQEYVRLVNSETGKVTVHRGENLVFPGPHDTLLDGQVMKAMELKTQEFVKIMDMSTGSIRVERGEKLVVLGPNDRLLGNGKQSAIEIDEENAVIVRDKATGQLRMVTEKQLFIPSGNEIIEEVRRRVKLADHEAMIIKDPSGNFQYYYGNDEKRGDRPRSFFLEPYHEVAKLCWSRGRRREKRDLIIEVFDCRAQYMSFEFNCRTRDNVELVLEGTFFWEVEDLVAMMRTTGDAPGDICNHARSQFIRLVSQVTLKEFMEDINSISRKVHEEDQKFYAVRGVKIHSLEVTRYACADKSTSEILEEIIQETTNRMNRLSQAQSENEVAVFRMHGQIEQEKLNTGLLDIQHKHKKNEADILGQAEANRVASFLTTLEPTVASLDNRLEVWRTLRKNEALSAVAQGSAQVYFTPSDVNLSIETRQ